MAKRTPKWSKIKAWKRTQLESMSSCVEYIENVIEICDGDSKLIEFELKAESGTFIVNGRSYKFPYEEFESTIESEWRKARDWQHGVVGDLVRQYNLPTTESFRYEECYVNECYVVNQ